MNMTNSTKLSNCQRYSRCRTLKALFQLLLALTIFNIKIISISASIMPEVTMNDNGDINEAAGNNANIGYDEKRSWQSLQGSWGKRSADAAWNDNDSDNVDDDDIYFTENWAPVIRARSAPMMQHTMVYLTRPAALERIRNYRQSEDEPKEDDDSSKSQDNNSNDGQWNTKRTSWNDMRGGWGKRRNAPSWNKFRGAWGKREPGWNNLKGMWGKRGNNDWQKLHGSWGKRSAMN